MLIRIRYDSTRFTRDADFSTTDKHDKGSEIALLEELDAQIDLANDQLNYDTMCLRQSAKLNPQAPNSRFPTLNIRIGYAPRSHAGHMRRLLAKQSPTILEIDCSYDEAVYDVELLMGCGRMALRTWWLKNIDPCFNSHIEIAIVDKTFMTFFC